MNLDKINKNNKDVIKEYGKDKINVGDLVMQDGVLCKLIRKDTGYTIREYFSHHSEKGPGPGWDNRWWILEKYKIMEPSELPDEPYFCLELERVEE